MEDMSTLEAIKTTILLFGGVYILIDVVLQGSLYLLCRYFSKKADEVTEIFINPLEEAPWPLSYLEKKAREETEVFINPCEKECDLVKPGIIKGLSKIIQVIRKRRRISDESI